MKQDHCFQCGSTNPNVRLNAHAHMLGHMIPGWQNVPEICDDDYHDTPVQDDAPNAILGAKQGILAGGGE